MRKVWMAVAALTLWMSAQLPAFGAVEAIDFYKRSNDDDNFLSMVSNSLSQIADRLKIEVKVYNHGGDTAKQLAAARKQARPERVMVVRVNDPESTVELIKIAKEADTTIIFTNVQPDFEAMLAYDKAWFVNTDAVEVAQAQAALVADYLQKNPGWDRNGNGTLDLLYLKGPEHHNDAKERDLALKDTLRQMGIKYQIVASNSSEWSYEQGFKEMCDLLDAGRYGELDMVISHGDEMAMGAIDALEQSELFRSGQEGYLPVFSVDGYPDAENAVMRGAMVGTVFQNYRRMAMAILDVGLGHAADLEKHIKGVRIINDRVVLVPSFTLTATKLGEFQRWLR